MTHSAETRPIEPGIRGHLRRSFARESFPPKWLLVVAILAVILGLSWANYRIANAEAALSKQSADSAQFAQSVDQTVCGGRPATGDAAEVCDEAKDKANDPVPEDGFESLRGEAGERGFQGLQGLPGQSGEKGAKGDKGDKGDLGPVAPALIPAPGQDGLNGTNGADSIVPGPPGEEGVPGEKGEPGPAPSRLTFSDGTTCTPDGEGSTEYSCDGPPPGPKPTPTPSPNPLLP